jgi:NADH-quinone oxidoreductase subunit E
MQQDIAHAVNLLAHPMASLAAASAVSLGLATQAWGLWFGALAGAMENARRPSLPAGEVERAAPTARTNRIADAASRTGDAADVVELAPRIRARDTVRAERRAGAEIAPTAPAEKPRRPDDLKKLPGVGPKLEKVLNGLGIWTHAQVAGWSGDDVARLDDKLGLGGRIGRDGWVEKAAELAQSRRR